MASTSSILALCQNQTVGKLSCTCRTLGDKKCFCFVFGVFGDGEGGVGVGGWGGLHSIQNECGTCFCPNPCTRDGEIVSVGEH